MENVKEPRIKKGKGRMYRKLRNKKGVNEECKGTNKQNKE